jgi:hypothetical protein
VVADMVPIQINVEFDSESDAQQFVDLWDRAKCGGVKRICVSGQGVFPVYASDGKPTGTFWVGARGSVGREEVLAALATHDREEGQEW